MYGTEKKQVNVKNGLYSNYQRLLGNSVMDTADTFINQIINWTGNSNQSVVQ